MFSQTHGVGPGLYDRDELSCLDLRAQRAQRALNRRGMVSEIIVNHHTVRLSQQFQPSLHTLERCQRLDRNIQRHPNVVRRGDCSGRIGRIVRPDELPTQFRLRTIRPRNVQCVRG